MKKRPPKQAVTAKGKSALTRFRIFGAFGDYSLVELPVGSRTNSSNPRTMAYISSAAGDESMDLVRLRTTMARISARANIRLYPSSNW